MMLNIARTDDPCYRYQMPAIQTQVQGRDRKTFIVNLPDIAHALGRDSDEIVKFMSCRLGVASSVCCLKGEFPASLLQDLLQDFIDIYVICQQCGNPETSYKVKKGTLRLRCSACGHKSLVESSFERVHNFILKKYS